MQGVTELFEISLPLLKKSFLGGFGILLRHLVVAIRVRPLEHSAAMNDSNASFCQELQLLRGIRLQIMQLHNLVLDVWH